MARRSFGNAGRPARGRALSMAACALGLAALLGCRDAPLPVDPVPMPEQRGLAEGVRHAVARAQAAATSAEASPHDRDGRARAQGELAMTCHAQQLFPCAQAAYRNAQRLAPKDKRWPYLLGHLYADAARPADAKASFESALAIDPADAPALFSLGEVQLKLGDAPAAERLFRKLLEAPDAKAAALAGLGKAKLAQRRFREAIPDLQEALRLAPSAARLRYPLAMAWRGVGDEGRAREVLAGYSPRAIEPTPPDPTVDDMASKVASPRGLLRRGQRYAAAGRFDLAMPVFETGVRADPHDAELLANLGIALANLGRVDEGRAQLVRALQEEPSNAPAHAALAALLDREGRDAEAAGHYEKALAADPGNDAARLQLADLRMREGDARQAVALYREAARRSPSPRIRMSLALALVRLERFAEAKAELEQGLQASPDHLAMRNALARLLCAAPDRRLRDGPRALALVRALLEQTQHPEVGQTFAMALAESGDFAQAAKVQQQLVEALAHAGQPTAFVEDLLSRYRAGRTAPRPWAADDSIFRPRSPVVARHSEHGS